MKYNTTPKAAPFLFADPFDLLVPRSAVELAQDTFPPPTRQQVLTAKVESEKRGKPQTMQNMMPVAPLVSLSPSGVITQLRHLERTENDGVGTSLPLDHVGNPYSSLVRIPGTGPTPQSEGWGVISSVNIPTGIHLMPHVARRMNLADFEKAYGKTELAPNALRITGTDIVFDCSHGAFKGMSSFINTGPTPNVRFFVEFAGMTLNVTIQSVCPITVGEQLIISYGHEFYQGGENDICMYTSPLPRGMLNIINGQGMQLERSQAAARVAALGHSVPLRRKKSGFRYLQKSRKKPKKCKSKRRRLTDDLSDYDDEDQENTGPCHHPNRIPTKKRKCNLSKALTRRHVGGSRGIDGAGKRLLYGVLKSIGVPLNIGQLQDYIKMNSEEYDKLFVLSTSPELKVRGENRIVSKSTPSRLLTLASKRLYKQAKKTGSTGYKRIGVHLHPTDDAEHMFFVEANVDPPNGLHLCVPKHFLTSWDQVMSIAPERVFQDDRVGYTQTSNLTTSTSPGAGLDATTAFHATAAQRPTPRPIPASPIQGGANGLGDVNLSNIALDRKLETELKKREDFRDFLK